MNVLITGGAGYVGSILAEHLLDRGHRVTVIDNLLWGEQNLFHLCADPRFEFIFGDARDEALLSRTLAGMDVLVPLACIVGAPACDRDPELATSLNFGAVRSLNRLRSRDQLVIFPTTNSGYGTKSGDVFCTEETPLEPISLYGRTKVDAEKLLLDAGNAITLRLATVFGLSPRMRLDLLVNHFTYLALTEGSLVLFEKDFKRNFVHVRDVADCFAYCIDHAAAMIGKPYNLGLDSANLSKAELAEKIAAHVPGLAVIASEVRSDPDKRNYVVSNERLRQAGFEARRDLDQGIAELLKGYRLLGRRRFANV
ncbi:MAG: NAD(P)-dependent oxidoreductase [bacterium]